ncbi:MerR family transcriptional regulator [Lentibacillus sediminis]|uniref:MerR family transcriptional regulator n=1 Tax=Lentibacillus sediminis TaxID=1940529 RepID=UPI001EFE3F8D|nr:MerR family DNA-binding transcriptional regulator [Lentibacillus sediminis]
MSKEKTYSISDLALQFDISTRTIRYYEEIGLLAPKRSNNGRRIFTRKEKTRLQLIFRGKKYGFNLEEIREMIQLFDQDPTGKRQLEKTIEYGQEKVEEVTQRIDELVLIRTEMERLLDDFQEQLITWEDEEE